MYVRLTIIMLNVLLANILHVLMANILDYCWLTSWITVG